MTEDWISTLLSPAFVTFKEREPISQTKHPQLQECMGTCDLLGLTASLDHAISIIPTPKYPEVGSKVEEFHARYGWVNTQLSDGSLIKGVPQVSFDSHPNSDGRIKDHQLFGESYLVLWLCPFDIEPIREHFRQQIKHLLPKRHESPSFSRFQAILDSTQDPYSAFLRGDADVKKYLRCEIIDRLSLLEPVEDKLVNVMRQELNQDIDDRYFTSN